MNSALLKNLEEKRYSFCERKTKEPYKTNIKKMYLQKHFTISLFYCCQRKQKILKYVQLNKLCTTYFLKFVMTF